MIEYYTLDKVLNSDEHINILNTVKSLDFPWNYNSTTIYPEDQRQENIFQFVHLVFSNNQIYTNPYIYNGIIKILKYAEKSSNKKLYLSNAKINLLPRQPHTKKDEEVTIHIDRDTNDYMSIVYYLEDSDGDTVLYNNNYKEEKRYTPKANSCIIFNSNILHCGIPPVSNKVRRIINIVAKVL